MTIVSATTISNVSLSAMLITGAGIITASWELGAPDIVLFFSGIFITVFLVMEWSRLALVSRIVISVCAGYFLFLLAGGAITGEILLSALSRASFFGLFVVSLEVLRDAAMTSPLIKKCGKIVVEQPPGRRYAVLTAGGQLLGILLNMGSMNVLGTMVRRSTAAAQDNVEPRVREIRLQRMTLAMLRGFCSMILWAPTSVTVFVVLHAIPELDWYSYWWVGLSISMSFLMFGWLLDRLTYAVPNRGYSSEPLNRVLLSLLPLVLLNGSVLVLTMIFSNLLDLRLIGALLICVPIFGVVWIGFQYHRVGIRMRAALVRRRVIYRLIPSFSGLRSEVAILCGAGFLSGLILSQIDPVEVSNILSQLGMGAASTLLLTQWGILLLAIVGVNPVVTVIVSIEVLAQFNSIDINPWMLAITGTLVWAMVTGVSPFASAIRMTCRTIDKMPYEVGLKWNGLFTLIGMGFLSLAIIMFA